MNFQSKHRQKLKRAGKRKGETREAELEEQKENLNSFEPNRGHLGNFGQFSSPQVKMPPSMTNSNLHSSFMKGGVLYESGRYFLFLLNFNRNEGSPGKELSSNLLVSPIYEKKMNMNSFNNIISPCESGQIRMGLSGAPSESANNANNFYMGSGLLSQGNYFSQVNSEVKNLNFLNNEYENFKIKTNFKSALPPLPKPFILQKEQEEKQITKCLFDGVKIETPKKKKTKNWKKVKNKPAKKKSFKCRCDKSKCLKKYCECYSNGEGCDPAICKCSNCENLENKVETSSVYFDEVHSSHERSKQVMYCNCTKSNCKKQYCECFKSGRKCNKFCRCLSCKNTEIPNQLPDAFSNCFHINIQIVDKILYEHYYSEELDLLSRKRTKLFSVQSPKIISKSSKNPVFTTTCATSSKKTNHAVLPNTPGLRKKLEMKAYKNETIFNSRK